jgi:luciferase-like monooxygenase
MITPSERITDEVTSWPDVEAGPGRRGEFAFTVGRHEIGHLHGDRAAHFFFGKELGPKLKKEGRVVDHPVFPGKPGPAARRIETEDDVRDVIELLRLNYDRVRARSRGARATDDRAAAAADPLQDGQPAG